MKDVYFTTEDDIIKIELEEHLEQCDCGNPPTWLYMPRNEKDINPYYCDECVPRGCSCDIEYTSKYFLERNPEVNPVCAYNPEDYEYGWIWVEEGYSWRPIDEKGKLYPCCEFFKL